MNPRKPPLDHRERDRLRREAAAAYDAMAAARPLQPPPLRLVPPTRTAGELALARAIRRGEYEP